MNNKILLNKFTSGLFWNGIFYIVYKILFLSLSITLYYKLDTAYFSQWAMINSIVFIIVLWLDCGFKKSIPRYYPLFVQTRKSHTFFIKALITFQAFFLVTIGVPVIWAVTQKVSDLQTFSFFIFSLFFTEGLIALLRLFYHAHFWQKQFNMLHTFFVFLETLFNVYVITFVTDQVRIITLLLFSKIIFGTLIIFFALLLLSTLYQTTLYTRTTVIDTKEAIKGFIKHSLCMWATTFIKSLSERNVLFPYITYTLGPSVGNLFKVTHDSALFFQRVALKTIGTADSSLLGYLEEDRTGDIKLQETFMQLLQKITIMSIPLITMSFFVNYYPTYFYKEHELIKLFFIIVFGYIIELLLSPFERVLESKFQYRSLWIAYTPYLICLLVLHVFKALNLFSLTFFIMIIQIFRIIGSLLMMYFAQKNYNLLIPLWFTLHITLIFFIYLLFFA
ncbi:hypothetical protein EBU95_17470 [bacterium]|nr:hypothetical protein [bacterium]